MAAEPYGLTERRALTASQNQLGQALGAKGRQTRRRLLEATELLIGTVPLRQLHVANVAEAAGTSSSTFYVYFQDVTEAVLARSLEVSQSPPYLLGLLSRPWSAADAASCAQAFVAGYIEHLQLNAPLFRVRNLASDEGDSRFSECRVHALRPLVSQMAARVREQKDIGALPPDLDPSAASGALLAWIERIAFLPSVPAGNGVTHGRLAEGAALMAEVLLSPAPLSVGSRPPAMATLLYGQKPGEPAPCDAPVRNSHGKAVGARGAETRQKILDAIDELLRERSLFELTVAEVARKADVSNATFYLYFEDVPGAVLVLIGEISQSTPELVELLERPWPRDDPGALALAFARGYVGRWRANKALFRVRNLTADEGDARFDEARRSSVYPLYQRVADLVRECQRQGRFPAHLHPVAVSGGFFGMLERISATPAMPEANIDQIERAAAFMLSIMVRGLPTRRAATPAVAELRR